MMSFNPDEVCSSLDAPEACRSAGAKVTLEYRTYWTAKRLTSAVQLCVGQINISSIPPPLYHLHHYFLISCFFSIQPNRHFIYIHTGTSLGVDPSLNMTTADVRDMLDLPTDGQPRPAKKQKTVEKRPGQNTLLSHHTPILSANYRQRVSHVNCTHCWAKELRLLQSPNTSDSKRSRNGRIKFSHGQ